MLAERNDFTGLVRICILARLRSHQLDFSNTIGKTQRCFKTVSQSTLYASLSNKTIDHNFDRVVFISSKFLVRFQKLSNLDDFAIDASAREPLS